MADAFDIARKLGPKQKVALVAIPWATEWVGACPTPAEVAEFVARRSGASERDRKPTSEAEAMANTLRSLERRELAERVGVSPSGARTWRLTTLGAQVKAAVGRGQ